MASAAPAAGGDKAKPDIAAILKKSGMRALGGGLSGAAAMGINVGALMWLRTVSSFLGFGMGWVDHRSHKCVWPDKIKQTNHH
jgi:hypothetical protein